jgi:uncharacterized protein (TIGR03000 family)
MRNTLKWLSGSTLVALLCVGACDANAGHGSGGGSSGGYAAGYGSSGGYSAGYGSSGGYSAGYGSSGGSSGGGSSVGHVGPLRRLHAKIHDHVHAKVAARSAYYGSSYGSSGGGSSGGYAPMRYSASYGSSGGRAGYSGSFGGGSFGGGSSGGGSSGGGSSGGSAYYGSSYSSGGSSGYSYGVDNPGSSLNYGTMEVPGPSIPMESGYSGYSPIMSRTTSGIQASSKLASGVAIQPTEVHLTVKLPESAKVFVNGNLTSTTGELRRFVSRDLKEDQAYRFEVKAVLTHEDGSEVFQNKTVVINSGFAEELTFDMKKADDPVETILTLNVPENAKVVLAQNATKSDGSSRVYRTKQLREGQAWDDYKIEVTYEGVTKEKTIRLIGGDKLELSFKFDSEYNANKVASN